MHGFAINLQISSYFAVTSKKTVNPKNNFKAKFAKSPKPNSQYFLIHTYKAKYGVLWSFWCENEAIWALIGDFIDISFGSYIFEQKSEISSYSHRICGYNSNIDKMMNITEKVGQFG